MEDTQHNRTHRPCGRMGENAKEKREGKREKRETTREHPLSLLSLDWKWRTGNPSSGHWATLCARCFGLYVLFLFLCGGVLSLSLVHIHKQRTEDRTTGHKRGNTRQASCCAVDSVGGSNNSETSHPRFHCTCPASFLAPHNGERERQEGSKIKSLGALE